MSYSDLTNGEQALQGVGASPGVVHGPAFVLQHFENEILERDILDEEIPRETQRLEEALEATRKQLQEIKAKVSDRLGADSAAIFDAHLLVLEDQSFFEEVLEKMRTRRKNIDIVLHDVTTQYAEALEQMDDEYLRERAVDIRDVARRIARNLAGKQADALTALNEPGIVVASDITPSDTAVMDTSMIKGLIIDHGSVTSHTAILARALEIPAVVGLHDASIRIREGETVIVDGNKGRIAINPTPETLQEFDAVAASRRKITDDLKQLTDLPAETLDGYRVMLSANLELPAELPHVQACGARGIGLWRTEFLYLASSDLPDEESQYEVYRNIAEAMNPEPLIIRTVDLGGDKFTAHLKQQQEMNPFLGWRAIRFCLEEKTIFRSQLRAIIRASVSENVHILIPFISCVKEVDQVLAIIEEVKEELSAEGVDVPEDIPVGAMIEIPSAALTADLIAPKVDFLSIGTNDLIQYVLAVDRNNERIAHLYNPAHLSVLKLIQSTIQTAHRNGIWVGICGEMAGDPKMVPLLIGMGADELSVNPGSVHMIKNVIRHLRFSETEELAARVMEMENDIEVKKACHELLERITPELLELL